ncbi:SLBB domain-containing protein [Luteolibacter pohnpeiensis]|uniref:SLBB domain-containing protein n=1 Tax=Luteolibacter pohnpeiensis TaxID=454153 RepID=A0A934VPV3_9BACT|nr:SLBB domain-containing protein [Luteolibacter pohnpeiensis]MBK1881436.1 SLBB domain-containing protein [Luteolibacter pohnpeiensis]
MDGLKSKKMEWAGWSKKARSMPLHQVTDLKSVLSQKCAKSEIYFALQSKSGKQHVVMKIPILLCLLAGSPLVAAEKPGKSTEAQESKIVTVGGQVKRPGPVAMSKKLTLYQAIQAAGGVTPFGAMNRVKVHRNGEVKIYDLTKDENMSVKVQEDDTIEVPQKTIFGR